MNIIFIKSSANFETFSALLYKSLGVDNYLGGDSHNVLGGHYNSFSIFGMTIRLELNSYGYEDEYKYMLQVKKDFLSALNGVLEIEDLLNNIILTLLKNNLNLEMAIEINNDLVKIN